MWTPTGLLDDAVVELVDGVVGAVRPPRGERRLGGLLVPGLVNAHTHVELSGHAGRVPGGDGFVPWAGRLMQAGGGDGRVAEAAAALVEAGTAWVWDVSNTGGTATALAAAGLGGVVQHEVLGFDRAQVAARVAALAAWTERPVGAVRARPSPHALFSTAPELVQAALAAGDPRLRATVHVGEDPEEAAFLRAGEGAFAALLDRLGRDWRWWAPPGAPALEVLDTLGALGPRLLLVHAVHVTAEERALAVARGAPVCFCPRSNLHIGGRLADAPAWLDAGAVAAVGTDSLASSPDLDVLGELAVLADAFPGVPAERWLALATHEGAAAVGAPWGVGRLAPGARGGVVQLDVGTVAEAVSAAPARRWLVRPAWCDPG